MTFHSLRLSTLATYGGVQRLRVSSQAWKRATRLSFGTDLPEQERGIRTRRLEQLLRAELDARGIEAAGPRGTPGRRTTIRAIGHAMPRKSKASATAC